MKVAARSGARLRILVRRLVKNSVLRNSAIYLTGTVGAGLFNYVFHFTTGHLLGPSAYSLVASAVASLYLLTLPALVAQIVSMRFTSVLAADDRGSVRPLLLRLGGISLVLGGIIALALLLASGPVADFLRLPDRRVVIMLAVTTVLGLLVSVNRGALQGLRRFVALSLNLILDGVARVVFAVAFIAAGLGAVGAIAAVMLGPAVAYVQTMMALGSLGRSARTVSIPMGTLARYTAPTAIAVMGVTYLFSVDVILARHYLSPHAAGIYAAASVLARVIYFLGLTVAGVMFPEVTTLHARNQAHYHVVDTSLAVLGGCALLLTGVYFLVPGLVVLPYGGGFADVAPYLATFALALGLLAIANLLVNYFLSVDSRRFVGPLLAACVLETALISVFHDSLWTIVRMLLITTGALAAVLGATYGVDRVRSPSPAGPDSTRPSMSRASHL